MILSSFLVVFSTTTSSLCCSLDGIIWLKEAMMKVTITRRHEANISGQLIYFGFLIGSNIQFSLICLYLMERLSVNWECHLDLLFATIYLPDLTCSLILNKMFYLTVFFSCPVISRPIISTRFCLLPLHCFPSKYNNLFFFQLHPVFYLLYTVSAGKRRKGCQRVCVCVFLQEADLYVREAEVLWCRGQLVF